MDYLLSREKLVTHIYMSELGRSWIIAENTIIISWIYPSMPYFQKKEMRRLIYTIQNLTLKKPALCWLFWL
jgi:hypothetical protein